MYIGFMYGTVVLIWATTPLAIQWSNSALSFSAAIMLRMVFALVLSGAILAVMKKPLIESRRDWQAFLAGAIGLYPNMLIVYWSAQYIPSGLMAVILGFYPFAVGIFSFLLYKQNLFTVTKAIALCVAIIGLALLHVDQMAVGPQAVKGILGMFISACIWGLSSVWLKKVSVDMDPVRQNTGTLLLCTPFFVASWWFLDGKVPDIVDHRSVMGVTYLVLVGSLLGHTLFFCVLKACSVATVSLIPLITPVMAMSIGYYFAGEQLTLNAILGAGLIILSLGIYQSAFTLLLRRIRNITIRIKWRQAQKCEQSTVKCL